MAMNSLFKNFLLNSLAIGAVAVGHVEAQTKSKMELSKPAIPPSMVIFTADVADGDTSKYQNIWQPQMKMMAYSFSRRMSVLEIGDGKTRPRNYEAKEDSMNAVMLKEGLLNYYFHAHGTDQSMKANHEVYLGLDSLDHDNGFSPTITVLRDVLDQSIHNQIPLHLVIEACNSDMFLRDIEIDHLMNKTTPSQKTYPPGTQIFVSSQGNDVTFTSPSKNTALRLGAVQKPLRDLLDYTHTYNGLLYDQTDAKNDEERHIHTSSGGSLLIVEENSDINVISPRHALKQRLGIGLQESERVTISKNYQHYLDRMAPGTIGAESFTDNIETYSQILKQKTSMRTIDPSDQNKLLHYLSFLEEKIPLSTFSSFLKAEHEENLVWSKLKNISPILPSILLLRP